MKILSAYNPWLLTAAALMFLTALIHVFAGGADIYTPLRSSDLALEPKAALLVVWHAISLFLVLFAGSLFWISKEYNQPLACLFGLRQLGFALLFIGFGILDSGNLTILPQWTVFVGGALLMWLGHRREV